MKTAISLPDNLFQKADRVAKRLGLSRSELYRRAVEAFIRDQSGLAVREALDRVYSTEENRGRLDPGLERIQEESLPKEEW